MSRQLNALFNADVKHHQSKTMTAPTLPETIRPSLVELQSMLHQFWRDELKGRKLPLAFWEIEDDNIFYDALQYVSGCFYVYGGPEGEGHSYDDLKRLPIGLQLAVTIFELEDGFTTDGWTTISNMGTDRLADVLEAYRIIGLTERAAALKRVIKAFIEDPENEDALPAAAKGELPDMIDDDDASARVLAYLRDNANEKFGLVPEAWNA